MHFLMRNVGLSSLSGVKLNSPIPKNRNGAITISQLGFIPTKFNQSYFSTTEKSMAAIRWYDL
jgi:hypothetical protein